MRDPNRIYDICNRLAELWLNNCPDWRFAQLYSNITCGRDLFYVEDDELIRMFEDYFGADKKQ